MSPLLDNNNAAVDQMSAQDSKAKADVAETVSKVWNQERVQSMATDLDTSTHVTMSPTQTPLTVLSQEGAIRTQLETESDNLVTKRPIDSSQNFCRETFNNNRGLSIVTHQNVPGD